MCGFAGLVAWTDDISIHRTLLARMSEAIAHRGPDGEDFYFNSVQIASVETPKVAMAFRRLAVIDPDPRAMQPMSTADGRYTLVFNGEIYNYLALRDRLTYIHPDFPWCTTGDSEVLLQALIEWGPAALDQLNGMYAFAFWDAKERTLLLARDRMGQKPLYVGQHRGAIVFASEVSAIECVPGFARRIDLDVVRTYLTTGSCNGRFVDHVRMVPPGCHWTFRIGEAQPVEKSYFDPNASRETFDDNEARGRTGLLIRQAVQRQLVSDVPLGVFLSGGIDSSIIALCAREQGRVQTFSIGFAEPEYDESRYAAEVAKHIDSDHTEFHVVPQMVRDLPRIAATWAEPFADSSAIPTFYLCRETRKRVTVALSGDGGDELFGGYDRYRAMGMTHLRWLSPLAPLGGKLSRGHPKSPLTRVGRLLASAGLSESDRYDSYQRIFSCAQLEQLMKRRGGSSDESQSLWDKLRQDRDAVQTALAMDRVRYLPDDLLTKVDRASMQHGLEVRSPFMDHDLVNFAAGLTTSQLMRDGKKRLLREAFYHQLPYNVFHRPKMGFAIPIGQWFRDPLKDLLCDHLLSHDAMGRDLFEMTYVEELISTHMAGKADHTHRLYALLMLELWWKNASR